VSGATGRGKGAAVSDATGRGGKRP
jgi:hypothetical protein